MQSESFLMFFAADADADGDGCTDKSGSISQVLEAMKHVHL